MIWCDAIWDKLIQANNKQRLSHALVFIGNKGLGKKELAREFASYLLCSSLNKETKACGQCRDCRLFFAETHGDFYSISVGENKSIGIEQIRSLKLEAYQTTQRGKLKIFLIVNADVMTIAAANALLKVLEEPPNNCLFILTCSRRQALPVTILSRCHAYYFTPSFSVSTAEWIMKKTSNHFSLEMIKEALVFSCGAPLLAKEFLEENKITEFQQYATMFAAYLTQSIKCSDLIKAWKGKALADILLVASLICYDLLKKKQGHVFFIYEWLDKIVAFKKQLASPIALNEALLLDAFLTH